MKRDSAAAHGVYSAPFLQEGRFNMNRRVSALGYLWNGQVEFAGTKQRISGCFHFKLWWRDNITTVNLSSEIEKK